VKIEASKPNLADPDRDFAFHETLERALREIPADANAKEPAAMVARRSTGSGAP